MAARRTAARLRSASARRRRPVPPGNSDTLVKVTHQRLSCTHLSELFRYRAQVVTMTSDVDVVPGTDLARYLTSYPQEIAFGPREPEEVFDHHHTADLVLVSDGLPLDREKLLAHARPARKRVDRLEVEVHDAVTSGDRVAARYTLTAVMRRGSVVATEICMFGRLADDGRLRRVDQFTRILPSP